MSLHGVNSHISGDAVLRIDDRQVAIGHQAIEFLQAIWRIAGPFQIADDYKISLVTIKEALEDPSRLLLDI